MQHLTAGPGRRAMSRRRALDGLLALSLVFGLLSAGPQWVSALELRAEGPPVGVVSNVITGPVRAVLPAAHTVALRTPPSLAPSSLATILLLLALVGGLAAVARTSWSGAWRRRPSPAEVARSHAVPAAWRGPPAAR